MRRGLYLALLIVLALQLQPWSLVSFQTDEVAAQALPPDLVITSFTATPGGAAGRRIDLTVTVRNNGLGLANTEAYSPTSS